MLFLLVAGITSLPYSFGLVTNQTTREEFLRTIPVLRWQDANTNEWMDIELHINVFENMDPKPLDKLCVQRDLSSEICLKLKQNVQEHIVRLRSEVESEVAEQGPVAVATLQSLVMAFPEHSFAKHIPVIRAEYNRKLHPEMFRDFDDIIERENQIVDNLAKRFHNIHRVCFIHSCEVYEKVILEEILSLISSSGLLQVLDRVVVLNYGSRISQSLQDKYSHRVEFIHVHDEIHFFEVPTLRILHHTVQQMFSLADASPDDAQVLYLHTKGASYSQPYQAIEDWRQMMLYFMVERYPTCIHLLASGEIDTVGPTYWDGSGPYALHYRGNFWWAASKYIAGRPELNHRESGKFGAEYWLLNETNARVFVLHTTHVSPYVDNYPRSCYVPPIDCPDRLKSSDRVKGWQLDTL